jgi:hypothetical protein
MQRDIVGKEAQIRACGETLMRPIASSSGGWGCGMNKSSLELEFLATVRLMSLPEPEEEYRFMPPRRYRFDFAYPEKKIAVEVEGGTWTGGRHTRGKGFESDCRKYNFAALQGWRVFQFTGSMIRSYEAAKAVREALDA